MSHRQPGPGRVRARLGVLDLLLHLWRSRLLIFLVFFLFVLVGLAVTQLFPANAVARSRVLVEMPPDISMTMRPGEAARLEIRPDGGAAMMERDRALSVVYAQAAIDQVGLERLAESGARGGVITHVDSMEEPPMWFLDRVDADLMRGSSTLELRFAHANPDVAIEALDAYVRAYVRDRNLLEPATLRGARGEAEPENEFTLDDANAEILSFIDAHGVSNLDTAISGVDGALAIIAASQIETQAALSAARGRVRELEAALEETDEQIELFVETVSTDRTAALASERDQMLARFGADHPVVRELDAQLAIARETPPQNLSADRRRTGPNPLRQRLAERVASERAEVAAQVRRAAALEAQRLEAEQKRRVLAALEPEWRALLRRRDALETAPQDAPKVEPEPVARAPVTIIEEARLIGDRAPRIEVLGVFAVLGAITGVALGLVRGWLARGLPGAGAAERTLGMRVLATVRDA